MSEEEKGTINEYVQKSVRGKEVFKKNRLFGFIKERWLLLVFLSVMVLFITLTLFEDNKKEVQRGAGSQPLPSKSVTHNYTDVLGSDNSDTTKSSEVCQFYQVELNSCLVALRVAQEPKRVEKIIEVPVIKEVEKIVEIPVYKQVEKIEFNKLTYSDFNLIIDKLFMKMHREGVKTKCISFYSNGSCRLKFVKARR